MQYMDMLIIIINVKYNKDVKLKLRQLHFLYLYNKNIFL